MKRLKNNKRIEEIFFPENFLFGVATAAYQNEGNNKNSQWYEWERKGKTDGKSGIACNCYREYKRDIQILKKLGVKAYRFSIEWSRIEPEEGKFDENAISHYRNVLNELKKEGIEPFVTLFHFSIPIWFADKGGFLKEKNIKYFLYFVERVAKEYKGLVKYWVSINEPVVYSSLGYLSGIHPPGESDFFKTMKVFRNLVLTHINTYNLIKKISRKSQIGIVKQESVFEPFHESYFLNRTVNLIKYLFNELFLESIFKGNLFFPLTLFSKKIPKRKVDFIGLNYYYRFHAEFSDKKVKLLRKKSFLNFRVPDGKEKSDQLDLEIYSKGIYQLLHALKKYKKPIYITENGVATRYEEKRIWFIKEHLKEIHKAIGEGVDVRGYFYWTLFDNFEWHLGYMPKFGLLNRKKKPKDGFYFYRDVCRNKKFKT